MKKERERGGGEKEGDETSQPPFATAAGGSISLLLFIYTHFFIYLMRVWDEGAITAVICSTNVQSRPPSLM